MSKRNSLANRFISILVLSALCFFCFCGCQKNDEKVITDEGVTFTDALGQTVTVANTPQRTAALIGSFADVWSLAGGNVCATVEDAWEDFDLDLEDAQNLGGAHSPSLEALIASNPDFVIASASTASNVEMKDALQNAGITVAYFDVDNFDDYLDMLKVCTDITGRNDLYEQNGTKIKSRIEKIKDDFTKAEVPEEECKVLIIRTSASVIKAKGSEGTILGEMLSDLGCINIADSDKSLLDTLSVESIIRNEPYHIFVVTMGDDTEKAMENLSRMMDENPTWKTLEAVKENRFHVMDKNLFNIKPNAKWADAYEELTKILLK